jgi:hypothetical protein
MTTFPRPKSTNTPDPEEATARITHLEYDEACESERKLWAAVKGLHPGRPGHDPQLWQSWLDAEHRVRQAAAQVKKR